ncbi:MAG: S1 RNA-binding domain-containing protein [Myxococcota bacterium]|jgi:small subunit ribosomal protein S1|nr:S1 RNA-binding domain-containing protein [Myxococcota bacterium]
MTEEHTEQEERDFHNTILQGSYVESNDEGHVFSLKGSAPDDDSSERALVLLEEFSSEDLPAPGEAVELLVERPINGFWVASHTKARQLGKYDYYRQLAKKGGTVEGVIVASNRGGLTVDAGLRAFVPWSHVDIHRVDDPSPYIGRAETFSVLEFDEEKCELVLSRSQILKKERARTREETLEAIEPGKEFTGVVRSIKNYGAFVDIGGIEGLLHVSNMSWGRLDHPNELVRPGDEIRVAVLEYDAKRDRLSLGRKQLLADPWEGIDARFSEGSVVGGSVVSLADFGAFIELEPGLEGLVHVTELSWTERVNHPRDLLEIGQEVGVKIIGIDGENRRLSLSVKQLERNPWEEVAERFEEGTRVVGPVRSITDFGAFVEVMPGIEGLVHVSNVSWSESRITASEFFKVGDEIEVMVLGVDVDEQRLELGIKQLEADPWREALEIAKPGQKIEVEISRLVDFGAFAKIVEGVEGLIHISELSQDRVEDARHVVRPGQTLEALVLAVDKSNRRISLSLKRDSLDEPEIRSYSEDGLTTGALGDILREQLGLSAKDQEE